MTLWVTVAAAVLVLAIIVVVFRVVVRRSYRRWGRLSGWASAAQYVAILTWVGYGCLNLPRGWPAVHVGRVQEAVGWLLFAGGWALVLITLVGLGVRRSHGLEVTGLRQTGPYAITRNPQAVAFVIAMVGYLLLWPTWRSVSIVLLVVALAHLMIRSEEEHLQDVFKAEYDRYCERVPRYLGLRGRPGAL